MMVLNVSGGPRVFHLKEGGEVVLQNGEAREIELADPDHKVLRAWVDAGEVQLGADAERKVRLDQKGREDRAERMASLRKELAELEAMEGASENPDLAAARAAPPAQFGGDGGPKQMPTLAGEGGGGKPTPKQEEARKEDDKARASRSRETKDKDKG